MLLSPLFLPSFVCLFVSFSFSFFIFSLSLFSFFHVIGLLVTYQKGIWRLHKEVRCQLLVSLLGNLSKPIN